MSAEVAISAALPQVVEQPRGMRKNGTLSHGPYALSTELF
jgi:hypothetical protein